MRNIYVSVQYIYYIVLCTDGYYYLRAQLIVNKTIARDVVTAR